MGIIRLNLPTVLTLSRVILIPVFIFTVVKHPIFGAIIFGVASMTDFLDGYVARRLNKVTKFGIIFDPIADKFLIVAALFVLVDMGRLPSWIAIIITVREFLVTALRVVALSKDIVISAEIGGKLKTSTQIAAILCLILGNSVFNINLHGAGTVLIWISLMLAVISGVQYTVSFWKKL
jgi:CDP-diacylglycerol--glycerol-3-phosphate 3-phosphatidyltransferase